MTADWAVRCALGAVVGAATTLAVACEEGTASAPGSVSTADASGGAIADPYDATSDTSAACTQIPLPDGGTVHVTGTVFDVTTLDSATPRPIAGAMVAVEYGGLYLPYCDMANASPYYVFGAISDANGHFEMDARQGMLGFHGFATGYFYSRAALDTSTATTVTLSLEPLPAAQAKPKVQNAAFDSSSVTAGARVTFSAGLTTWAPTDPLSDENVLVEETQSLGIELNPPSVGKKDDFPDGTWSRSFTAPSTPGTYTYWFSATTAGCVTSDLVSAVLTVR